MGVCRSCKALEKGHNILLVFFLGESKDRAWWAIVYRITQSQTRRKQLSVQHAWDPHLIKFLEDSEVRNQ